MSSLHKRIEAIEDSPQSRRAAFIQSIDHWIQDTLILWDGLTMPEDDKADSNQFKMKFQELADLLMTTDESLRNEGIDYLYRITE